MALTGKTRWADVTEAELAAEFGHRLVRPQQRTSRQPAPEPTTINSKPSKYRNVKTVADGHRFDSQREATRWMALRAREAAGEIEGLQRQVRFPLYAPQMDEVGATQTGHCLQVAEYVADFVYREAGKLVVEDAKARRISPYPLKAKWLYLQQGIKIVEV